MCVAMLRRRRSPTESDSHVSHHEVVTDPLHNDVDSEKAVNEDSNENSDASFRVAKWAILRMLGMVYLMAFLGALFQNRGLIGMNGLEPASEFMTRLQRSVASPWQGFRSHPTLFWWLPLTDHNMDLVAIMGVLLSSLVLLGLNSWLCMFLLWLLDFSIVTINEGASFYSYGWESQLLETGFLAIFLCDLPHIIINDKKQWKLCSLQRDSSAISLPSPSVLWLFRWLCFRISLGAGLIKIRGSSCWATKTCLHHHFETQPIPSPLSFVFHFLPKSVLTRAVDLDLWVQLYTSWFVLLPSWTWFLKSLRRMGGFLQSGFMVNIILSGNFAFLNHLTIIPALACLDDECWPTSLRRWIGRSRPSSHPRYTLPTRPIVNALLVLLIGSLSLPVVSNLLQWSGSRQRMNASFDSFRLVNTYGAFGSVGEKRYEAIISISNDGSQWVELELPCKPGDVTRRPCFCAPYHYRLDWNIWFLGFKPHRRYLQQRETWLYSLLSKILDVKSLAEERPWLDLLDSKSSTFLRDSYNSNLTWPVFAKVDMFEYKMAGSLWTMLFSSRKGVAWWERKFEENLIPSVKLGGNKQLELATTSKIL